jgi:hypothetical protein
MAMMKVYSGTTLSSLSLSKTTNGGSSWTALPTNSSYFYINDIDGIPGVAGKFVSVGIDMGGNNYGSSYTEDHGASWINIDNGVQYISCRFKDDNTGWAGGFNTTAGVNGVYKWQNNSTGNHESVRLPENPVLYPNPANEMLYISMDGVQKKNLTVTIYDILGNAVYNDSFFNLQKNINLNINCSELNNGVYIAVITADGNKTTHKFIVNR